MTEQRKRIIVGITGASGAAYGLECLDLLREANVETHLVVSKAGELTLRHELNLGLKELEARCDELHAIKNVGASIASGSFRTVGMVIAPCSVRTAAEIATGVTSTLLTRAADVTLKERRPLVIMIRETPLHLGHLRTLTSLAEMGAIIAPPVPAFYTKPQTLEVMVRHTAIRALEPLGLDLDFPRWTGL